MNEIKNKVNQLHEKAMDLAEEALYRNLKKLGKAETIEIYKKAFQLEKEAAMLLQNAYDIEPTRSVLFQSAANLAYNAEMRQEAEKMIGFALSGNPPHPIDEELKMLLIDIQQEKNPTANSVMATFKKVKKLPENAQKEVVQFVDALLLKYRTSQ